MVTRDAGMVQDASDFVNVSYFFTSVDNCTIVCMCACVYTNCLGGICFVDVDSSVCRNVTMSSVRAAKIFFFFFNHTTTISLGWKITRYLGGNGYVYLSISLERLHFRK